MHPLHSATTHNRENRSHQLPGKDSPDAITCLERRDPAELARRENLPFIPLHYVSSKVVGTYGFEP